MIDRTQDLMAGIREANDQRDQRIRDAADPECHICKGRGVTANCVAPGKIAYPPCRCTGIRECE